VRQIIGADRLFYQDLPDLIEATRKKGRTQVQGFDTSVFDGTYVTGDVTPEYLQALENRRNDGAKEQRTAHSESTLDLHNSN
jgi:amidophosphoribosyltransferase